MTRIISHHSWRLPSNRCRVTVSSIDLVATLTYYGLITIIPWHQLAVTDGSAIKGLNSRPVADV